MNMHRRRMLCESAMGFGSLALTSMLMEDGIAGEIPLPSPYGVHHPATAKTVIFLFMSGAPWPDRHLRSEANADQT